MTDDATSFDHDDDRSRWQDGSLWMDGRSDGAGEGRGKEDKGNPEASTGTWIKGDSALGGMDISHTPTNFLVIRELG